MVRLFITEDVVNDSEDDEGLDAAVVVIGEDDGSDKYIFESLLFDFVVIFVNKMEQFVRDDEHFIFLLLLLKLLFVFVILIGTVVHDALLNDADLCTFVEGIKGFE